MYHIIWIKLKAMKKYFFVLLFITFITLGVYFKMKNNEKKNKEVLSLKDMIVANPVSSDNLLQKILKEDSKWLQLYEREPKHKPSFTYLTSEHSQCRDETPFVVIFIASRPSEVEARLAIRASWASKKQWHGKSVLTLFLLGNESREQTAKLYLENEKYRDIIIQDFLDSYENLTHKTRMAFQWLHDFCPKAQYIMKTDTDVFVNPGNLVNYLLQQPETEHFYTGYPFVNTYPYRNTFSKNYISTEEYPLDIFPPYGSGLGYVISGSLALRIYDKMCHVKPFRIEDVYVGVCVKLLGDELHIPKDHLFFLFKTELADKIESLIAAHWVNPAAMRDYWETLHSSS
ncbi:UDP-GalNAc:beta-1,3-N-acetylgalactosaminyltransferase 1-like [Polyodon spathula]|uniref:UDP-GalNAc:beta-1, 3-N-acetylgalactosaminyltransferase 1-like n=1 Tax=Polyodon spathula TaxID=7913 RepID=UPI001B7E1A44|nr:UDP-GalNAc:beta-1,3-N-acetylgalactosaminyltransferase 1-like [Polyodon spathula]